MTGDKLSIHHMEPVSVVPDRKKDPTNKKSIPVSLHQAWHTLFGNLRPPEIIDLLLAPNFCLTSDNKKRAWLLIFGDVGVVDAAEIVEKEWTPPTPELAERILQAQRWQAMMDRLEEQYRVRSIRNFVTTIDHRPWFNFSHWWRLMQKKYPSGNTYT